MTVAMVTGTSSWRPWSGHVTSVVVMAATGLIEKTTPWTLVPGSRPPGDIVLWLRCLEYDEFVFVTAGRQDDVSSWSRLHTSRTIYNLPITREAIPCRCAVDVLSSAFMELIYRLLGAKLSYLQRIS